MSFLSSFSSPDHLESITFWFDVSGALVEFGVAVTAAIIAHKEFGAEREKTVEKYVAVFAFIAAFLVLSTVFLNHRVSILRQRESTAKDTELAEARTVASNALTKASALETRTKARTISQKTKQALVEALLNVPKGPIELVVFSQNAEGVAFATQLQDALTSAGCTVTLSPRPIFDVSETGLIFCAKEPSSQPLFARVILSALVADGIEASAIGYNGNLTSRALQIWVCAKHVPSE